MTNALINEAADMIAEFDPAAASIFRNQPFNRRAIAYAFERGFRTHSTHSFAVCKFLRAVVAADKADRAIEAAI
jgi:hypothetical protein